MNDEFEGKVALITGAGSGIGEAVAVLLARAGACVAVLDLDLGAARRVSDQISKDGGQAISLAANVTGYDSVMAAVEQTLKHFGGLHLAVNNAGIAAPYAAVGDIEPADWQRVLDVNLTGVYNSLRCEIPALLSSHGGAIVNVSSILGINGMAGRAAYVAAKHGVIGLTKSAALDYAERGIRVNAVAPGYVDTPLLGDRDSNAKTKIADLHPMRRLAQAEEIAETIIFMLSRRASFMTGHVCVVDGGYSAR
jgi:NAD(P)-dependent dehydrogenase (short-subunit alcohol dehydrogenase family)